MNSPSVTLKLGQKWTWPDSLWVATARATPPTAPLEDSISLDTVIVGAGFTGLRAALVLAEAGQRVAVLESCDIGWGASGRNGGQVNPLLPLNGPGRVSALVGAERFPLLTKTMLQSANETFGVISRYAIDCQARQSGWIRADHCGVAMRQSRAVATAWNRHGAGIEFLEGTELEQAIGTGAYKSATLMRSGGALQPLSYARGLAAAQAAGAAIHSDTPALKLERDGSKWRIETPKGQVTADQVLLCTNGYTDKLWPGLAETVIPLVSIQAASEPLSGPEVDRILPEGRTIADTRRTIIYGRHEPDGRILFGSLGSFTGRGDEASFAAMQSTIERIYPSLKGVCWQYRWGGRLAVTQDHLPHLHQPAPGLLAGLGYNGRGVAMSTIMGRVLAERVLGKAERELPFPISPIQAYPLHRFHRLGGDLVTRWMRFRDEREFGRS